MGISVPSSLGGEELTRAQVNRCCPICLGERGGGSWPQSPAWQRDRRTAEARERQHHPCHHQQEEKQAAPPGMTLEGQPIRRGAAPGAATSKRRRTRLGPAPPPVWKGLCKCNLPFYAPSRFQNSAANGVLLCKIGNKDARTLPPRHGFALLLDKCTEPRALGLERSRGGEPPSPDRRTQQCCPGGGGSAGSAEEGWLHQSCEVCRPLVSYGRDTIDMQVAAPLRLLGRPALGHQEPACTSAQQPRKCPDAAVCTRTPRGPACFPGCTQHTGKPRKCYWTPCLSEP